MAATAIAIIPTAPMAVSLVRVEGAGAGASEGAGAGGAGVAEKRLRELTRTKARGVVVAVAVDVSAGVGVDLFAGRTRWDCRIARLVETALLAEVVVDRVGVSEGRPIAALDSTFASVAALRRCEPSDAMASTTAVRTSV